jgi:hypothetical protein
MKATPDSCVGLANCPVVIDNASSHCHTRTDRPCDNVVHDGSHDEWEGIGVDDINDVLCGMGSCG